MVKAAKKIYLSPPHITGNEKKYVIDAIKSNWVAPLGPYVNLFEDRLRLILNKKNVITLSSCTAALHLSLLLAGVGVGDTVFCSNLTFAASAFPIVYCGARPVFIDSEPNNYNMDPEALLKAIGKEKNKPKALILVHLYGVPANVKRIKEICDENNIVLIEDAAEALGSTFEDKPVGTFGDFGTWSFNGNKIITTSGGGALYSKTDIGIKSAYKLSNQAKEDVDWYEHNEIGYNYRLSNICAAIGLGQLECLDEKIKKKKEIYALYSSEFDMLPYSSSKFNISSNYWLSCCKIKTDINKLIHNLANENIEVRRIWKPMNMQPVFKDCNMYSCYSYSPSADLFYNGICLPSDTHMTANKQFEVIKIIKNNI
ncbi:MAG: aminotransferase class I/II-fold pyridoxal phosphate-dependent enzyme [Treponema sp.]|jgi:pyridoxal phosphate-dependent aminotransferase EpsN|nr:aminotransferase class I/II-fold pyridoxal phosphate-dependent enzyme [Treponema sp.]